MTKYIYADILRKEIERRKELLENGTGHPKVMERVEGAIKAYNSILAFIDSLQQDQTDDVCSVIKEYYSKELPFEDEKTKAAYYFFSAGRSFELKKIEEERVKHITDLLDNYQKGKKVGYKEAISKLKEGKIECSPVIKELIDKLFGIGNTFNFGFGPKDFLQEQLKVDLDEETLSKEFHTIQDKCFNQGIEGWQREKLIARHFYELGKASKED